MNQKKSSLKAAKEQDLAEEFSEIYKLLNQETQRALDMAKEKGSSAWLSSLPLSFLGFVLNKQEFRDGVCLRYSWPIQTHQCTAVVELKMM